MTPRRGTTQCAAPPTQHPPNTAPCAVPPRINSWQGAWSSRAGWPAADHLLETPREQRTWFELEHGRSVRGLLRKLAEAGLDWDPDDLTRWLHELRGHGLVFTEGGRWVSLATTALAAGATRPPIRLRAAAAV